MKAPIFIIKYAALSTLLCTTQIIQGSLDAPSIFVHAFKNKYCTQAPPVPLILAVLTLTKTDSTDPVPAGTPFNYILTVTNTSAVVAQGVLVTDTLPLTITNSTVTFNAGASSTTQGTISANNGIVTVTIGALAPGETVTIILNVTITNTTSTPRTVTNTAVVTGSNAGSVQDNEQTIILN